MNYGPVSFLGAGNGEQRQEEDGGGWDLRVGWERGEGEAVRAGMHMVCD